MTRFFKTAFDYMSGKKAEEVGEILPPQPKRSSSAESPKRGFFEEPQLVNPNIQSFIVPRYIDFSHASAQVTRQHHEAAGLTRTAFFEQSQNTTGGLDPPQNSTGLTVAWINNFKPTNTYKTSITMTNNPFFKWDVYEKKVLYNI